MIKTKSPHQNLFGNSKEAVASTVIPLEARVWSSHCNSFQEAIQLVRLRIRNLKPFQRNPRSRICRDNHLFQENHQVLLVHIIFTIVVIIITQHWRNVDLIMEMVVLESVLFWTLHLHVFQMQLLVVFLGWVQSSVMERLGRRRDRFFLFIFFKDFFYLLFIY